jgi:hypothetical protein
MLRSCQIDICCSVKCKEIKRKSVALSCPNRQTCQTILSNASPILEIAVSNAQRVQDEEKEGGAVSANTEIMYGVDKKIDTSHVDSKTGKDLHASFILCELNLLLFLPHNQLSELQPMYRLPRSIS